jgi:hypothetical protein
MTFRRSCAARLNLNTLETRGAEFYSMMPQHTRRVRTSNYGVRVLMGAHDKEFCSNYRFPSSDNGGRSLSNSCRKSCTSTLSSMMRT